MLKADDVNEVVPHVIDVNEAQVPVPLYNCISGLVKLDPCPLIVTVCEVLEATNLYQTSECVPMLSQPDTRPVEVVAFTIVPARPEQLVPELNVVAPLHSSFPGGGG